LANDEELKAQFKEEYGYEWDIDSLTWDQYLDASRFFLTGFGTLAVMYVL
jgi:hypothetical protein